MKTIFTPFTVFLYTTILFTSCGIKTKDLWRPDVIIQVSNTQFQLESTGGTVTFIVESNYDWSISGSSSECAVTPLSGIKDKEVTVVITVLENIDVDRQFLLTINADNESRVITVNQEGTNYARSASQIVVERFEILPKQNQGIYTPVSFIKDDSNNTFVGEQEVLYYKTDLTNLAASWSSNAKKVMIGNILQENGATKNNYERELAFRFYATDDSYKEYKVRLSNPQDSWSGLPILVITTDDNKDIMSKDVWSMGKFKLDPQDNGGVVALEGITEIRGRGNSTWTMPKKPYALKLKDKASGTFMGMNAHKRWVLLANHADKTSLRNRLSFEIGKQIGLPWAPDSRFVEVILNGKFVGNYLLTEHIKIDPKRVDIEEIDNKETNGNKITGGWLMEVDRYYSNGETRYFRPDISQLPMIVKEPEDANTIQMNYIKDYFNSFERLIYPLLPAGIAYHKDNAHLAGVPDSADYGRYIDINSFVNYWIVQELSENRDSRLPGSVYMHKGVGGKLYIGPLWDFDQTTYLGARSWLHYDYVPTASEYLNLEYRSLYYNQLFKDPKFKAKVKERWSEVYSKLMTDIPKFIDLEYASIAKSLDINWIDIGEDNAQGIWSLSEEEKNTGGRNHDKNLRSGEAVARLKNNYIQRVNWMNSQINNW